MRIQSFNNTQAQKQNFGMVICDFRPKRPTIHIDEGLPDMVMFEPFGTFDSEIARSLSSKHLLTPIINAIKKNDNTKLLNDGAEAVKTKQFQELKNLLRKLVVEAKKELGLTSENASKLEDVISEANEQNTIPLFSSNSKSILIGHSLGKN